MRVAVLQHVSYEPPGKIRDWAEERGYEVRVAKLYECASLPRPEDFDALVVMGGPMSVHDEREYPWLIPEKKLLESALASGKKVLGICLGAQLLAEVLGAEVARLPEPEIGWYPLEWLSEEEPIPARLTAFHWHSEGFEAPNGCRRLARSKACPIQAFALGRQALGLQFHLEVTPEIVSGLYAQNSRLPEGRFVQTRDQALAEPSRFAEAWRHLSKLLDLFLTPD